MAAEATTRDGRPSPVERARRRLPHPSRIAAVVAVLATWQLLSLAFPSYRFPGLVRLAENVAVVLSGTGRFDPAVHLGATVLRVLVGFAVSFALAVVWGLGMGVDGVAEGYLGVPLFTLLTVPSVVWAFLGVLWFGLTEHLVPLFVVVLVVFPYLAVNVWEGTQAVDDALVEMARAFDASRMETWRHVHLPQLLPTLFASTRLGLALAWKLSLVAEVFGASTGVGVAVKFHFENFDTGMVVAWAIPVMALMFGIERLLERIERRTSRWRGETGGGGTATGAGAGAGDGARNRTGVAPE